VLAVDLVVVVGIVFDVVVVGFVLAVDIVKMEVGLLERWICWRRFECWSRNGARKFGSVDPGVGKSAIATIYREGKEQ